MNERKIIESILLLADEPVPTSLLGEVLEVPKASVQQILSDLAQVFEAEDRGFVLRETAGGWRLYTHPDCDPWLERFVTSHRNTRLTGAALEVLAIVAYRQPISRAQIGEIRGVDSDGVVKTLEQRGLLVESGRDPGPGTPVMFTVSPEFLERMGLRSTDELPPLAEFMPDAEAVEDMEAKLSPNA
ncbi:MAG: segregation and condensation protein [Actinomycetota bacterium]|jgi:segregation and condensation protein B|nr:segregation and condensation protein [Actinomycetota bacterium]